MLKSYPFPPYKQLLIPQKMVAFQNIVENRAFTP